jgi:hypothetical protein
MRAWQKWHAGMMKSFDPQRLVDGHFYFLPKPVKTPYRDGIYNCNVSPATGAYSQ